MPPTKDRRNKNTADLTPPTKDTAGPDKTMETMMMDEDEMDEDDSEDMKTILDTVGIDYDKVITQYKKKQRFFSVTFDEPCGMSHK